ncbi:hypothetical protein K438DRAFT_1811449 [Mycena galopus ATCC 62051]|nr:hypothetical protein K438DRAFT_1811449 [Mycena galopus ATCC 62051]
MQAPVAVTCTTAQLHRQICAGEIGLDREYQREVIWPDSKQIGLIESIMRNHYIPPIVFAVEDFEDGTIKQTCIDGKQRLTSIHRFMKGLIPYQHLGAPGKLRWYCDNPDHRTSAPKTLLEPRNRDLFNSKAIVCIEYHQLDNAAQRDIHRRLNLCTEGRIMCVCEVEQHADNCLLQPAKRSEAYDRVPPPVPRNLLGLGAGNAMIFGFVLYHVAIALLLRRSR